MYSLSVCLRAQRGQTYSFTRAASRAVISNTNGSRPYRWARETYTRWLDAVSGHQQSFTMTWVDGAQSAGQEELVVRAIALHGRYEFFLFLISRLDPERQPGRINHLKNQLKFIQTLCLFPQLSIIAQITLHQQIQIEIYLSNYLLHNNKIRWMVISGPSGFKQHERRNSESLWTITSGISDPWKKCRD